MNAAQGTDTRPLRREREEGLHPLHRNLPYHKKNEKRNDIITMYKVRINYLDDDQHRLASDTRKNVLTCGVTQCSFLVFSGQSIGRSQDFECEVHLN
jgi:hypothetical protein